MRSKLYLMFTVFTFFLAGNTIFGQTLPTHFLYTANTGNNATIGIQTSINPMINGTAIAVGDEIGVFTPEGLCVGAVVWTGSNLPLTVWGDNDQTTAVDGIGAGEQMQFRMWRQSTNTEYPAQVTFTPPGTGTYAANSFPVLGSLVATSQLLVKIKVFLQGPYSGGGMMATNLAAASYIPTSQPYSSAPFNYTGTEAVVNAPFFVSNNIVDWIIVELRTGLGASTTVDRRAALLKNDGTVLEVDGSTGVAFSVAGAGNYYIAIKHRNHFGIISAGTVALPNSVAYDFTTAQAQANGTNPMVGLSDGPFGMYSGDANQDAFITAGDISVVIDDFTKTGYKLSDSNLDGLVSSGDITFMINNFNKTAQMEY